MRLLQTLFLIWIPFAGIRAQSAINTIDIRADGTVVLEDFSKYEVGELPDEWYNRDGEAIPAGYPDHERRHYNYFVQREDGKYFLRYEGTTAKHLNLPLADKKEINIYRTPVLSWEWRVHQLPKGGNEDQGSRNDVAASIYVVFDMGRVLLKRVPKSIRYTWSSTLPEGSEHSKLFGNQKIVVVASGEKGMGEWRTFERNIVEDYRRLFGSDPPETPLAILILSDGDDTNTPAKADYGVIKLKPQQP